ncbi:MAG: hypothetical protein JW860_00025 [Sedimentisphaerales bacterium]|nr:hypothetical protein [Sedimentisphaerales bacterium]
MKKMMSWTLVVVLGGISLMGCRPYKGEKFEEVQNHETAFVIPFEGDLDKQQKLKSLESLQAYQVAIKRIDIPRRWRQLGRLWFDGEWIDTVKVIKVDRSPVTREWTAGHDTGTSQRNEGIWIESEDSVSFSTGFTCTAYIEETDAARFLYHYPNGKLAVIMDNQVRAEIQSTAAEIAAKYKMDELRAKKSEIIAGVRSHVLPFFANTGITISTIGMFGGYTYENADIQKAIDNTFVAQQDKVVAAAMYDAQEDKNRRIEKEAEALKNAAIIKANGEAQGIRLVAQAIEEANKNPAFLELRKIEVEAERVQKWDGQYPHYYWNWSTSGQDAAGILVNTPTIMAAD